MRAYFFWKDCGISPAPLGCDQICIWGRSLVDAFFVGATHEEATEHIRPRMQPAYQESLDSLLNASSDGWVTFQNEEIDHLGSFEHDGQLFFIVTRDLSRIVPWIWVYPVSAMWGPSNPWEAIGPLDNEWPTGRVLANLDDLGTLQAIPH